MNKITEIVNGRIVAVLLPGASILELEKEISYYKDLDICYVGINNFTKIEKNILSKINRHFDIVQDCSEVKYVEDYENQVRIPIIEEYLSRNENNFLLTSPEIIVNWNKINRLDLFTNHQYKIGLFENGVQYSVPNSLTLLLMYLGRYSNAKSIILFGCDSYNGSSSDLNAILKSYYNPEDVLRERLIGFRDGTASGLIGEMRSFDNNILNYYTKFAWQNGINPPSVFNCSHLTSINTFKVLNYVEVRRMFGLSDIDSELIKQETINKLNKELSNVLGQQQQQRELFLKNVTQLRESFQNTVLNKIEGANKELDRINSELERLKNEIDKINLDTTTYL